MIHEFTTEQWEQIHAARDEWLKIGRSTEPAERSEVERAITYLYERLAKPRPRFFWWDSPLGACIGTPILNLRDNLRANLYANLRANLDDNLDANLRANLYANLRANLRDNLDANLRANLNANLEANLEANLRANLDANLYANLEANLYANLEANLEANLDANLRANLRANLDANLYAKLYANLNANLDANLYAKLYANLHDVFSCRWSPWWNTWYMHCDAVLRAAGLECDDPEQLGSWLEISRHGGWFFVFDGLVSCCERPSVLNLDRDGRLHSESGPAMAFRDGYGFHAWHGTRVPAEWIEKKSDVDPSLALTWDNVEQRRCLAEILGWDAVLRQLNPRMIDQDPDPQIGTLVEVDLPDHGKQRFLRVRCATGRDFALFAPNDARTAIEAQARNYGVPVETMKRLEFRT